jgi:hypothetical protein
MLNIDNNTLCEDCTNLKTLHSFICDISLLARTPTLDRRGQQVGDYNNFGQLAGVQSFSAFPQQTTDCAWNV